MNSSRPPWQPNSQKPRDLKRTDKMLYSFKLDLNQPSLLSQNFKNVNNEHFTTLKRSQTISKVNCMLNIDNIYIYIY